MDPNRTFRQSLIGLLVPAAFIVLAFVLVQYVDEQPERTAAMTRGLFGPTAWPTIMLYAVGVFAAGWLIQDLLMALWKFKPFSGAGLRQPAGGPTASRRMAGPGPGAELRILAGIALIGVYGYLIVTIGFAFATLLFLAGWTVLGGIHRPRLIVLVSTLGTLGLVYLFVKVASMPLSRGEGVFAEWTIALYRYLRVF